MIAALASRLTGDDKPRSAAPDFPGVLKRVLGDEDSRQKSTCPAQFRGDPVRTWRLVVPGFLSAEGEFHLALSFNFSDAIRSDSLAGGTTPFSSLPSGDCTDLQKKKKSSSSNIASHRVSSQNAKFYHSAQADSVFQVREQSEVPFSTFSGTSLKVI